MYDKKSPDLVFCWFFGIQILTLIDSLFNELSSLFINDVSFIQERKSFDFLS